MTVTGCKYEDPTCDPSFRCEACIWDDGDEGVRAYFLKSLGHPRGSSEIDFRPTFVGATGRSSGAASTNGATEAHVTARWAKRDGNWVIKLPVGAAREGDTVTVTKADGSTAEVTLGADYDAADGFVFWNTVRKVADRVTFEPGFYKRGDGAIVKVKRTKDGARTYGMVLDVNGGWEYERGALKDLTRLTVEEAKAYGHLTGRCCCCGRELTNETSIELGIGPICLAKNF